MVLRKLRAVEPKCAEPTKPKILIFGREGVGKTFASTDFPSVYYIDAEGGSNRSQYIEKLEKSGGVYFGRNEGAGDFSEVIEEIKALATTKHPYKTVVIDSLTKVFNEEIRKEADRLGDKDGFGASKKQAIKLCRNLVNWVEKLDMNVILICQEKDVWGNDKKIGVTFDAWEKLGYELDLCLNITKTGASRKAQVIKSRITTFPDGERFDWNYKEFARRYGEDVIDRESKEILIATDEQVERVKMLVDLLKIDSDTVDKWLDKAKVEGFEEMDQDSVLKCIKFLEDKINHKGD